MWPDDEAYKLFEALEEVSLIENDHERFRRAQDHVKWFGERYTQSFQNVAQRRENILRHRVILVHGIRTNAPWYETARKVLSDAHLLEVDTPGYGWVNLVSFLLPPLRFIPYRSILSEIRSGYHEDYVTSIVAHSFGSYLVSKILIRNPDIRLFRLVLCGSVTSSKLFNQIRHRPHKTVNEVGMRDFFPVLSSVFSYNTGAAGYTGLRAGGVVDRFHNRSHDFNDEQFMKEWWLPFLVSGKIDQSADSRSENEPWGWKLVHGSALRINALFGNLVGKLALGLVIVFVIYSDDLLEWLRILVATR